MPYYGVSPTDLYNMAPTRAGGVNTYLNLKKQFADAIRQHEFEMQKQQSQQQGNNMTAAINQGSYTPTYQDLGVQAPPQMSQQSPMAQPDQGASMMAGGASIGQDMGQPQYDPGTIHPSTTKNLALQEKQSQFDQRQWSTFVNKNTPTLASSRSTLGMAAGGNLRADRALVSIQNNPTMTYQDLGNVVGDLAGIYQGGAPTDMAMKHQQYESIQSNIANLKQYITGKPQDAVPSAIKQKLIDVINNLKMINNDAINRHFDVQEKAQKKLISRFPDEWKALRQQISENYGVSNNIQNGQQSQTNRVGKYTYQ